MHDGEVDLCARKHKTQSTPPDSEDPLNADEVCSDCVIAISITTLTVPVVFCVLKTNRNSVSVPNTTI